jgi:hypothetical protein
MGFLYRSRDYCMAKKIDFCHFILSLVIYFCQIWYFSILVDEFIGIFVEFFIKRDICDLMKNVEYITKTSIW